MNGEPCQLRRVGDLVKGVSNWNPGSSKPGNTFCYIDIGAVDQGTKTIGPITPLPCEQAPSRARQIVESGDVLVSTVRPNLNAVAPVPDRLDGATASTGFCVLRPAAEVLDSQYLFHWVRTNRFVEDMVRLATGASYPAVSDRIVKESWIPLPPLPEQRRIAAILDQAEALRTKRRTALAKLDTLAQSIFIEMFEGEESVHWQRVALDQIADIVTGYAFKSEEYESSPSSIRLCRGANVLPKRIDWSDLAMLPASKSQGLSSFELVPGDVVMAMDRPWISEGFKIAQVSDQDCPALLVQRVARIRGKHGVPNDFLFDLLNRPAFTRHCRPTETTIPHISPKEIRSFELHLPPQSLQRDFARKSKLVRRAQQGHRESLQELERMFVSLQHRAFRGEL